MGTTPAVYDLRLICCGFLFDRAGLDCRDSSHVCYRTRKGVFFLSRACCVASLLTILTRPRTSLLLWLCLVSTPWTFLLTLVRLPAFYHSVLPAKLLLVQACCRSLIVDTLPIPLQQAGSAWGMSS